MIARSSIAAVLTAALLTAHNQLLTENLMKFLDWIDRYLPYAAVGLCIIWFVLSMITGDRNASLAVLAGTGWASVLSERRKYTVKPEVKQ
jgi:xanthine/uracil permease